MARPVKWSRDLHPIRERALASRTETWSRQEIEQLFNVGRASAQVLLRAIGGVTIVGGAHFVHRAQLLEFLDSMIAAPAVEAALGERLAAATPPPRPRTLRTSLPPGLRQAMLEDLPPNITLAPRRLEITAPTAVAMLESLVTLALVMQNDLDRFRNLLEPPAAPPPVQDGELEKMFARLRVDSVSLEASEEASAIGDSPTPSTS